MRLLPGTVGTAESLEHESHSDLLLEHPHYTRPASFRGREVPAVLRSGDHGAIARWRLEQQQQQRTRERRPDLYARWFERQGIPQAASGPEVTPVLRLAGATRADPAPSAAPPGGSGMPASPGQPPAPGEPPAEA